MGDEKIKNEKAKTEDVSAPPPPATRHPSPEQGGRGGLDPTRYGDWEIGGKCVDF